MLEIRDLHVSYGPVIAVDGLSLKAQTGTTTAILGANGAGKSSLLRAISGLTQVRGRIMMDGRDITKLPSQRRAKLGIAHALEGRRLFRDISVEINLRLAWSFGRRITPYAKAMDKVYDRFPVLHEKRKVAAGWLSGGQQQMVILSAAMIQDPLYMLLDEPSLGLAPIIISQIYAVLGQYSKSAKATILVAEQMAGVALKASDRAIVLKRGKVVLQGLSTDLLTGNGAHTISNSYL